MRVLKKRWGDLGAQARSHWVNRVYQRGPGQLDAQQGGFRWEARIEGVRLPDVPD
jgi:hypothetical protein